MDKDYESGPFCRHYDDLSCPLKCARCDHRCTDHDYGDGGCLCCDCVSWSKPEEKYDPCSCGDADCPDRLSVDTLMARREAVTNGNDD